MLQSFRLALKSLAGSKLRSFLTMLGIIIGVASVIVLVSLMDGMTSYRPGHRSNQRQRHQHRLPPGGTGRYV